jgi:hypothetical protein
MYFALESTRVHQSLRVGDIPSKFPPKSGTQLLAPFLVPVVVLLLRNLGPVFIGMLATLLACVHTDCKQDNQQKHSLNLSMSMSYVRRNIDFLLLAKVGNTSELILILDTSVLPHGSQLSPHSDSEMLIKISHLAPHPHNSGARNNCSNRSNYSNRKILVMKIHCGIPTSCPTSLQFRCP